MRDISLDCVFVGSTSALSGVAWRHDITGMRRRLQRVLGSRVSSLTPDGNVREMDIESVALLRFVAAPYKEPGLDIRQRDQAQRFTLAGAVASMKQHKKA